MRYKCTPLHQKITLYYSTIVIIQSRFLAKKYRRTYIYSKFQKYANNMKKKPRKSLCSSAVYYIYKCILYTLYSVVSSKLL